ncbi:MAG: hypothetical protein N3A59_01130 [Thermodesulfovibrionales bacterium]|nr:hypothetical protein [Thermodesulfovibrionales bacterium]
MEKIEQEIEGKSLDIVEADILKIRQSTMRAAEGIHVELQQSAALTVDADRAEMTQGGSVVVRGKNLSLNQSIGIICCGDNTNMNLSFSPISVNTGEVTINKSAIGIMASKDIQANNSATLFMIGRNISGEVNTIIDWRSALAFGIVAGGIYGLIQLLKKR